MKEELQWDGPHKGGILSQSYFAARLLPGVPGLYLWRKILRDDDGCIFSPTAFMSWLERGIESPLFSTDRLQVASDKEIGKLSIRANFLALHRLTVGGGRLPDEKREALTALANDPNEASRLYNFFHTSTCAFGPVLYVGESEDLSARFKQHMAEESPMRSRLGELGLTLSDTALYYCRLPNTSKSFRQQLESALTHLLVSPLTLRAG